MRAFVSWHFADCITLPARQIGPSVYMFNFTSYGARIDSGFEVTVTQAWIGSHWWGNTGLSVGETTGLLINGSDHVISYVCVYVHACFPAPGSPERPVSVTSPCRDVVCFSARKGIVVDAVSTLVSNVHMWNDANSDGGVGIEVNWARVRLDGCYLDWTDAVLTYPNMITVTNGFFQCGARIRITSNDTDAVENVYIAGNEFYSAGGGGCPFSGYNAVEIQGDFRSVVDMTVTGTVAASAVVSRSTVATLTVVATQPTTQFTADFTELLLFDTEAVPIVTVTYSIMLGSQTKPVAHAALTPAGAKVTVVTGAAVTGQVTITVDQSVRRV